MVSSAATHNCSSVLSFPDSREKVRKSLGSAVNTTLGSKLENAAILGHSTMAQVIETFPCMAFPEK
jgi:hypothetical protein